jgi:hypothetical protein
VLSKVDLKSWDETKEKYLSMEPSSMEEPQSIRQIKDVKFNKSELTVSTTFEEKIPFSFSNLIKGVDVPIVTKILLKSYENSWLMISFPKGLGLMVRSNVRDYIDTIIGPLLMKIMKTDVNCYHPIKLPKSLMMWSFWGEELRNIAVDIPEFGLMSLKGRDINRKVQDEPAIDRIISKGNISIIKVHSEKLGRVITVSQRGIFRVHMEDFEEITEFLMEKIEPSSILR